MKFKKAHRVVIAGSGPSLATISYDIFPHNAQIWRANDFFKEQDFFVGRRVDAVFNGGTPLDIIRRIDNIKSVQQRGEYDINLANIYIDKRIDGLEHLKQHFEYIESLTAKRAPALASFIKYSSEIWDMHLFSGVAAIIVAILSGFNEIYLAGIDCDYETGARYAYSSAKTNPKILNWIKSYHPSAFQWDVIRRYQDIYNVKIFTLSSQSPAAKLFPMAPKQKRPANIFAKKTV